MTDPVVALLSTLPGDAVAVRDRRRWIVAAEPDDVIVVRGADALDRLDALSFGFWAGWLAYDLGRAVERVVPRPRSHRPGDDLLHDLLHDLLPDLLPDLLLARFDARAVIDPDAGRVEVIGDGPSRSALEQAAARVGEVPVPAPPGLAGWRSTLDRGAFEAGVRAIVELIRAGECYQVNFTRRLECDEAADPLALFSALLARNPAPHAAFVRLGGTAVVSASPERFLRRDGRRVETRPIKGTGRNRAALAASAKDRAENVMIVDLARNDLGRVCEYGSIDVPALCEVEAHPGLHHLVSTVRGTLRNGVTDGDLIRATFPPASITGAPKPRVMQAIEDLEPVRRGVYCGAVGWVDPGAGGLDLNVAIRTFTITAGRTFLGVGGGIVADSDPTAEWEETELKVARLLEAAGAGALVGVRA